MSRVLRACLRAGLLAWILGGLLPGARADVRVVTWAYEPYRIGPESGLVIEIFLAACRAGGLEGVKVEMMPSERARRSFVADPNIIFLDGDTGLASLGGGSRYAMLKQWPYQVFVYYRKAGLAPEGMKQLKDLAGKQMGYYRADHATREYFDGLGAVMVPLDPQSKLFSMLVLGRIDAMVSVELTAMQQLDRLNPGWRDGIGVFGPYFSGHGGPLYHTGQPEVEAFLARYQEGYRRISADGRLQAINARYHQPSGDAARK